MKKKTAILILLVSLGNASPLKADDDGGFDGESFGMGHSFGGWGIFGADDPMSAAMGALMRESGRESESEGESESDKKPLLKQETLMRESKKKPLLRQKLKTPSAKNEGSTIGGPYGKESCVNLPSTGFIRSETPASAVNWVLVASQTDGNVYVDTDSIYGKGDLVKCMVMYNFKTAQSIYGQKRFLSSIFYDEINRNNRTERYLYAAYYTKHAGKGDVVHSISSVSPPFSIEPGSLGEAVMEYAYKIDQSTIMIP